MPRTSRTIVAGQCYHLINRGNNRSRIFHDSGDYAAFLALMKRSQNRCGLSILAYCLMPNHVHAVVRSNADLDVTRWTHWLFSTHVQQHHAQHHTTGRIWQGRFKACLIQQDRHLVTVIRYVERNPLRAGLVSRAEHWPWSSLQWRLTNVGQVHLAQTPVGLPGNWAEFVNRPQTLGELNELRACVNQQRPFGDRKWIEEQAKRESDGSGDMLL